METQTDNLPEDTFYKKWNILLKIIFFFYCLKKSSYTPSYQKEKIKVALHEIFYFIDFYCHSEIENEKIIKNYVYI